MPDYGHDLLFGVFPTPLARSADAVVELAGLAEERGLDLVTVQDHPYQPRFLDAWTLLAFVAARTSRVHLGPNVANMRLRDPALLARAAASLDILSGGRLVLGLGAGGFPDAVAAMGGERLTAGEAVDALDEAITVIRELWQGDRRDPVTFDGGHHRLARAMRGPSPAHEVPIWVGALRPRMLELVGRDADGWLPSLPYLGPGAIEAGNRAIDASAARAGRDPRAVRRLLNVTGRFAPSVGDGLLDGPADRWASELARLALDDGLSAFILMSDDPVAIERFADEVAPAVRERVEEGRARRGTTPLEA